MRWLLLNVQNRLRFAARNPGYAVKSLVRDLTFADERFIGKATGRAARIIRGFVDEPSNHVEFLNHLRRSEEDFSRAKITSADLYAKRVLLQYAAIRALRPELVVETGVANGISTSYLLFALHQNKRGVLHSIEIGDSTYLPPGRKTGWAVPEWLRERWQLHLGDARIMVPELLAQLGTVDVFIHDSLHTYEHMKFEFEQAYPHIRPGGLLISDDALWNSSFQEFAQQVRAPLARILRGVGYLRK